MIGARSSSGARRVGAVVGFVAASAMLAGCPPCPSTPLETWQFERCASGATCGWQTLRGAASPVETLVAGEHGLRLERDTEIEQQLEITLPSAQSTESVAMVARCDEGTSLRIDQFVSESVRVDAGADGDAGATGGADAGGVPTPIGAVPLLRRATAEAQPPATWTRVSVFLNPVSGSQLTPMRTGNGTTRVAFSLRIATVGAGACVIDAVEYSTFSGGRCG